MDKLTVTVRSAIKLDAKSLATLSKFVESKHNVKNCEFEVTIDPELIAGFKLMVAGVEYDYSISGSLDRMQAEL